VFVVFEKAANPFVATWTPQVGIAKIDERKPLLLLLLTHVVKLETACVAAFDKVTEAFTRILVLLWIVWFRTEIPALKSATAKRKDGEFLAAIYGSGS
jgi:hypothetical protein